MPDYLAPGVYVEEVSFRSKSIEGVPTSVAGFIGPTLGGRAAGPPTLVTSVNEYERLFGGAGALRFARETEPIVNDMALGIRAFFANGGTRAYVVRVREPSVTGDGNRPDASSYRGAGEGPTATGLLAMESAEHVSIIVAPGVGRDARQGGATRRAIHQELVSHCEKLNYRMAILDGGEGQSIADVCGERAGLDSSRAAMYYPWMRARGIDGVERRVPPSGFVAGVYARVDAERSVYKAPANEIVRGVIGPERDVGKAEQDTLNPEGVNVIRSFEGHGLRVWGARTLARDPEWKYVNVRRAIMYLERSIDAGTRWAVFEPNGETLWARVRGTIENFLQNEWRSGGLLGAKSEEAYFVRCDRSTMTQNDIDNGRLIAHIGVAMVKPAEFIIFRIGQWTANRSV